MLDCKLAAGQNSQNSQGPNCCCLCFTAFLLHLALSILSPRLLSQVPSFELQSSLDIDPCVHPCWSLDDPHTNQMCEGRLKEEEDMGERQKQEAKEAKQPKMEKMKHEVGAKFINKACAVTVPLGFIPRFQEAQKCMSDPGCLDSFFKQCTLQSSTQSIDRVTLKAIDQGSKLTGELDGAGALQRDGVRDGSPSLLCGQCVIYGKGSVSHRDQRWARNWLANKCRQWKKKVLTVANVSWEHMGLGCYFCLQLNEAVSR